MALVAFGIGRATAPDAGPQGGAPLADLSALEGESGAGNASLASDRGVRYVRLRLSALPPIPAEGFYEAWLGRDDGGMVALGTFRPHADGSADLLLPLPVDADGFDFVDISAETATAIPGTRRGLSCAARSATPDRDHPSAHPARKGSVTATAVPDQEDRMHKKTLVTIAIAGSLALPSTALADGAVRVLHASPNAPAVDVYVNGAKAVSGLHRGAITPYLSLPAGSYRYAVRAAGAPASSKAVLKGTFRVRDGKAQTLAARGFLRHLAVQSLPDAARAGFGVARIRVVHLSPDAPKVDVFVKGGGKVASKLRYRRQSGYLDVPAGSYTFVVRPSGGKHRPTVIRLDATLEAGKVYSAWALGSAKRHHGLSLRGIATEDVLPDAFARTQVRVLHASPDAPAVNVWVNGARAIPGLAFGHAAPANGSYLRLPSGPTQLQIRTADDATVVQTVDVTLPKQATLTVAARGTLSTADARPFELGVYVDDVTPAASRKGPREGRAPVARRPRRGGVRRCDGSHPVARVPGPVGRARRGGRAVCVRREARTGRCECRRRPRDAAQGHEHGRVCDRPRRRLARAVVQGAGEPARGLISRAGPPAAPAPSGHGR